MIVRPCYSFALLLGFVWGYLGVFLFVVIVYINSFQGRLLHTETAVIVTETTEKQPRNNQTITKAFIIRRIYVL